MLNHDVNVNPQQVHDVTQSPRNVGDVDRQRHSRRLGQQLEKGLGRGQLEIQGVWGPQNF